MLMLFLGLFLIGAANAESINWIISEPDGLEIHQSDNISIPFTLYIASDVSKFKLIVKNSNDKVATVYIPPFDTLSINNGENNTVSIAGIFLGQAEIQLAVVDENDKEVISSEKLIIRVVLQQRLIDTLFTISVAALVSILYINFGCAIDWKVCRESMKRPVGMIIGAFCQIIIMPLLAFGIGIWLFPNDPAMQLGVFFTGISPSGGASNIWTVLLGGNLPLSISMTTFSTIASFGTMPFWIFTLGRYIFEQGNIHVPYKNVAMIAVGLVLPLAIGYLIQRKFPRFCRIMVRIMKPFSIILILFIIIFAVVTNSYLFKLFSWRIILAGMGLPWIGFVCGLIIMILFRQPQADIRAIAIETGIQNTGIAIFLLRFSMKQLTADLTTVIPVSCAIMTPIPLTILWIIKMIFDKRQQKKNPSLEKLQDGVQTNLSTVS